MKIAKDLPKQDQEQKQPKKPYTTPRLTIYGDAAELTRGTTRTVIGDAASTVALGAPSR